MIAELGFANVPLPPSRPVEVAALRGATDAPTPVGRPTGLDRPSRDLIAAKLAAANTGAFYCRAHGREHDEAREVVERGEALPLVEILARLRGDLGGEVVGVSFKRKHGRWVYEFKIVGPAGRLSEIYVDAASAQILKREER